MTEPLSLASDDDWTHCITILCGIPLTLAFVRERAAALGDPADYGTQRFRETWGAAHLARVRGWFEQAQAELGDAAGPTP